MDFIIENVNIGIAKTVYDNIDLIIHIENEQENKSFITPYDKNRHFQVIDSKDEEHLTVWEKETAKIIGFIILAGLENPNLSLEFRRIVIQSKGKGFGRQCLKLTKNIALII
jgi:diamine N-acetyltransferase